MTPFDQATAPQLDAPDLEQEPEDLPMGERYWPDRPAKEVIAVLNGKERAFFETCQALGLTDRWRSMWAQIHGRNPDDMGQMETSMLTLEGEQDESVRARINEVRSFARQAASMATKDRPAFQCEASNSDYASRAQIESCDAALTYVYTRAFGEKKRRRVVEKGVQYGHGWTWGLWDYEGGEQVEVGAPAPVLDAMGQPQLGPNGAPIMRKEKKQSGAPYVRQLGPWSVFCEPTIEDDDEHLWRCVKERRSKWEMAALKPELANELRNAARENDEWSFENIIGLEGMFADDESDLVTVRHFMHERCAALPNGRYIVYVGDVVVKDEALPYDEIPLIPFCPSNHVGTMLGYADAWDYMPLNQVLDEVMSACVSNFLTFGRQSMFANEEMDIDLDAVANGQRYITMKGNGEPPKVVSFAEMPDGAEWLVDFCESRLQSLSGQNSVTRGQPDANISSGTMAALFHTIALEFADALHAAVNEHDERVANMLLKLIKRYAKTPFVVRIAGADERPYADTFEASRFEAIDRVVVKAVSPMMRTTSGRMEMFQLLAKVPGAIETPEQVISVVNDGVWKPVTQAARTRLLLIQHENEQLLLGKRVMVSPTDDHEKHLNEHVSVLNAPANRPDPSAMPGDPAEQSKSAVLAATMAHIQEHMQSWRTGDPQLAEMLGHRPPPMALPMPGAPGEEPPNGKPPSMNGGAPDKKPQPKDLGVALPKPAESPVPPT